MSSALRLVTKRIPQPIKHPGQVQWEDFIFCILHQGPVAKGCVEQKSKVLNSGLESVALLSK